MKKRIFRKAKLPFRSSASGDLNFAGLPPLMLVSRVLHPLPSPRVRRNPELVQILEGLISKLQNCY